MIVDSNDILKETYIVDSSCRQVEAQPSNSFPQYWLAFEPLSESLYRLQKELGEKEVDEQWVVLRDHSPGKVQ
jgi:hypothetical protein